MGDVGDRLKQVREATGLSQKDFATALEVSQSSIARYELGTSSPDTEFIIKMVIHFRIKPHWFITGEGPMLLDEAPSVSSLPARRPADADADEDDGDEFEAGALSSDDFWAYWQDFLRQDDDRRGWVRYEIVNRFPEFVEWLKKRRRMVSKGGAGRAQAVGE